MNNLFTDPKLNTNAVSRKKLLLGITFVLLLVAVLLVVILLLPGIINGNQMGNSLEQEDSNEPGNSRALRGIKQTRNGEKVNELLFSELSGDQQVQLVAAHAENKQAELPAPDKDRTGDLLVGDDQKIVDVQFAQAMTDGYAALAEKNLAQARQSFLAANALKADSVAAKDALNLVNNKIKLNRIAQYKVNAEKFAGKERWQDAQRQYMDALNEDATLEFAIQGNKRSQFFISLHKQLDFLLNHPERLASEGPYRHTTQLLIEAQDAQPQGSSLQGKITILERMLIEARIAVPVILESDGKTDILLYRVGRLGRFSRHEIELYPGPYTALGTCFGFQDIRLEFTVIAGKKPKPIDIRCKEVI